MSRSSTNLNQALVSFGQAPDPEAHLLVLQGQALYNQRNTATSIEAWQLFEEATRIDPGYALAWARLAATIRVLYYDDAISREQLVNIGMRTLQ